MEISFGRWRKTVGAQRYYLHMSLQTRMILLIFFDVNVELVNGHGRDEVYVTIVMRSVKFERLTL